MTDETSDYRFNKATEEKIALLYYSLAFLDGMNGVVGRKHTTLLKRDEVALGLNFSGEELNRLGFTQEVTILEFYKNIFALLKLSPEASPNLVDTKLDNAYNETLNIRKEIDLCNSVFTLVDTDTDGEISRADFLGVLDSPTIEAFFANAFAAERGILTRDQWNLQCLNTLFLSKRSFSLDLKKNLEFALTKSERQKVDDFYAALDPHSVGSFSENDCIRVFGATQGVVLYRHVFDGEVEWADIFSFEKQHLLDQARVLHRYKNGNPGFVDDLTEEKQARVNQGRRVDLSYADSVRRYIPKRIAKSQWAVPFNVCMADRAKFRTAMAQLESWKKAEEARQNKELVEVILPPCERIELQVQRPNPETKVDEKRVIALPTPDSDVIRGFVTPVFACPFILRLAYDKVPEAHKFKLHSVMPDRVFVNGLSSVLNEKKVALEVYVTSAVPKINPRDEREADRFERALVYRSSGEIKDDREFTIIFPRVLRKITLIEVECHGTVATQLSWKDIRLIALVPPTPKTVVVNINGVTRNGTRANLALKSTDKIETVKAAYEDEVNCECRWSVTENVWTGEWDRVMQNNKEVLIPHEEPRIRELFDNTLEYNQITDKPSFQSLEDWQRAEALRLYTNPSEVVLLPADHIELNVMQKQQTGAGDEKRLVSLPYPYATEDKEGPLRGFNTPSFACPFTLKIPYPQVSEAHLFKLQPAFSDHHGSLNDHHSAINDKKVTLEVFVTSSQSSTPGAETFVRSLVFRYVGDLKNDREISVTFPHTLYKVASVEVYCYGSMAMHVSWRNVRLLRIEPAPKLMGWNNVELVRPHMDLAEAILPPLQNTMGQRNEVDIFTKNLNNGTNDRKLVVLPNNDWDANRCFTSHGFNTPPFPCNFTLRLVYDQAPVAHLLKLQAVLAHNGQQHSIPVRSVTLEVYVTALDTRAMHDEHTFANKNDSQAERYERVLVQTYSGELRDDREICILFPRTFRKVTIVEVVCTGSASTVLAWKNVRLIAMVPSTSAEMPVTQAARLNTNLVEVIVPPVTSIDLSFLENNEIKTCSLAKPDALSSINSGISTPVVTGPFSLRLAYPQVSDVHLLRFKGVVLPDQQEAKHSPSKDGHAQVYHERRISFAVYVTALAPRVNNEAEFFERVLVYRYNGELHDDREFCVFFPRTFHKITLVEMESFGNPMSKFSWTNVRLSALLPPKMHPNLIHSVPIGPITVIQDSSPSKCVATKKPWSPESMTDMDEDLYLWTVKIEREISGLHHTLTQSVVGNYKGVHSQSKNSVDESVAAQNAVLSQRIKEKYAVLDAKRFEHRVRPELKDEEY